MSKKFFNCISRLIPKTQFNQKKEKNVISHFFSKLNQRLNIKKKLFNLHIHIIESNVQIISFRTKVLMISFFLFTKSFDQLYENIKDKTFKNKNTLILYKLLKNNTLILKPAVKMLSDKEETKC